MAMFDKSDSNAVATSHPVLNPLADVSQQNGNDELAERLIELRGWLSDDLGDLEELIDEFVANGREPDSHCGWQSAAHLLDIPGKRIRPICVLLAARLGGVKLTPTIRNFAVSCELVHAATLLHDDVIDEGTERRGLEASRVVYGNSATILGGDQLFVEAMRLVHNTGHAKQMARLFDVISEMIAAEALQLERRGRFDPSQETYLRVLRGKTAALFRWGLEAGGSVAGLTDEQIEILGQIGIKLGIAFQLVDDIIDVMDDDVDTGKDNFADLRQGKMTWPIIVACERDAELRADLEKIVRGEQELTEDQLPDLLRRIRATGAVAETRRFAIEQGQAANELIAQLPESRARHALEVVVETAIHRAR